MSKETAVAAGETDAPKLREPHGRRVVNAAWASHNASTRRNYHAAWRRFQEWSDQEGLSSMPAAPETVAAYLAWRADEGLSPATLRIDRAAIRYHHTVAGQANPADNEGVRRVLRGLNPSGNVGGPHPEASRCPDGRGPGRNSRDGRTAAHRPSRSDRARPHRPVAAVRCTTRSLSVRRDA